MFFSSAVQAARSLFSGKMNVAVHTFHGFSYNIHVEKISGVFISINETLNFTIPLNRDYFLCYTIVELVTSCGRRTAGPG